MDCETRHGSAEIDDLFSFVRERRENVNSKNEIKLLDVVALARDLPQYNLRQGQVGTVVELLDGGKAYEVEFSDRDGRTYESAGLAADQLIVLHFEPATLSSK